VYARVARLLKRRPNRNGAINEMPQLRINAEGAPPGYSWGPKGSVWGWLLPAHETVAPGVPQQGHWFLPQLDTPLL
jgi:hypothetical protein